MSLQYPFLTATLGLFGGICLAGVGLTGWQFVEYSNNEKKLKRVLSDREQILNSPIAPTEENLERAKKNYEDIVAREQELYEILKGKKTTPDTQTTLDTRKTTRLLDYENVEQPADLVNKLRESTIRLTNQFKGPKLRIYRSAGTSKTADFGFGFKRYVSAGDGTTPRSRLSDISLEKALVEHLVTNLVKAQNEEGSPLILQAVMREPVEITRDKSSLSTNINSDEYFPTQAEVLRRENIAKSYYLRLVFTARTGLVRRWINNMDALRYPLFLRGISVAPAKPEVLAPEEATPGSQPDGTPPFPGAPGGIPGVSLPAGFSGFGDTAQPLPAFPGAAGSATPAFPNAPSSSGQANNKDTQIILEATPSEFTVSFEYVLLDSQEKTSNN
jgi:hypothetical protein